MQPVDFYRGLLLSTGLVENKEGLGFLTVSDPTPITIKGKVLVLPTTEVLENFNKEGEAFHVFHPACENVMRKDSATFNFLKKLYRASIFIDLQHLMLDLIELSADAGKQKKLNKSQRALLANLTEFDAKTKSNLEAIFDKIDINGENKAVDFTVLRGHSINGEKYNRVGVARLPLYKMIEEALSTGDHKVAGVKVRKKDLEAYLMCLNVIFSDTISRHDNRIFETGTNTPTAPSFTALTQAYLGLKTEIIKFYSLFKDKFHSISSIDVSWVDGLDELEVYRGLIPALPGNEGEPTIAESKERKHIQTEVREPRREERASLRSVRQEAVRAAQAAKPAVDESPLKHQLSWADIQKRRAELSRGGLRSSRGEQDSGRFLGSNRRRYNDNIDLSDVDENQIRERHLNEDRYVDRYNDRRNRYSRYDDRGSFYRNDAPRTLGGLRR